MIFRVTSLTDVMFTVWFLIVYLDTGFVDGYCLNFDLTCYVLFAPPMVIKRFSGYSSLDWHMWFFRGCKISVEALLAFSVSVEKSGVILIGLPLYITWPFSLVAFNILSLFGRLCVLIIMCQGDILFWTSLIGVL